MVKILLLYVIRNRSYSHLKNVSEREHSRFWVKVKDTTCLTLQIGHKIYLSKNYYHFDVRIFVVSSDVVHKVGAGVTVA